jgi:hypothetical protein
MIFFKSDEKKQQKLSKAASDYMSGEIELSEFRDIEKENSLNYISASLQLTGILDNTICVISNFQGRKARTFYRNMKEKYNQ